MKAITLETAADWSGGVLVQGSAGQSVFEVSGSHRHGVDDVQRRFIGPEKGQIMHHPAQVSLPGDKHLDHKLDTVVHATTRPPLQKAVVSKE